ncbi:unnamed protein product [Rotaria sp. Silwood1]|nr:unnamed protein product [Rotaria sp. Silwood1]
MPKVREMNFTSAYEYLEERFDHAVRMCAFFTFSSFMLIYMAIVLYVPVLVLTQSNYIQFDLPEPNRIESSYFGLS